MDAPISLQLLSALFPSLRQELVQPLTPSLSVGRAPPGGGQITRRELDRKRWFAGGLHPTEVRLPMTASWHQLEFSNDLAQLSLEGRATWVPVDQASVDFVRDVLPILDQSLDWSKLPPSSKVSDVSNLGKLLVDAVPSGPWLMIARDLFDDALLVDGEAVLSVAGLLGEYPTPWFGHDAAKSAVFFLDNYGEACVVPVRR